MEAELGRVTSVDLMINRGMLTFVVQIQFGGASQAFGTYALTQYSRKLDRQVGTAAGADLLWRLLVLFGVERMQEIVGKHVYALRPTSNDLIRGLRLPECDGGRELLISDWKAQWFPEEKP